MTLEKAQKIVHIWGVYVEYFQSKLTILFGSSIPESFLPFPKETIEAANNIMAAYYYKLGNKEVVKVLEETICWLDGYQKDEEAIVETVKKFKDKKMRDAILPAFQDYQDRWIKTQKI